MMVDDALIKEALGNPKYDFTMEERITRPGIAIVSLPHYIKYLTFRDWHILKLVEEHS